MLCGGDSMLDLERLRADRAGAELRAVADVPAASTACRWRAGFAACICALARRRSRPARTRWTCSSGRSAEDAVTLDFDSTGVEVYGRNKPGAAVNYQGQLADQPLVCAWAERGRLLGCELLAGNASTRGEQPRLLLRRVLTYLSDGH